LNNTYELLFGAPLFRFPPEYYLHQVRATLLGKDVTGLYVASSSAEAETETAGVALLRGKVVEVFPSSIYIILRVADEKGAEQNVRLGEVRLLYVAKPAEL
jgi:hypothetical protein